MIIYVLGLCLVEFGGVGWLGFGALRRAFMVHDFLSARPVLKNVSMLCLATLPFDTS
jgi:hypothetical protein